MQHCCSRHHEASPRLASTGGGARQCTLFGMGGVCVLCPPEEEMASQRPGPDQATTGCTGDPRRGHGRPEGEDI